MTIRVALRLVAIACVATAAVIGFIDGLAATPALTYPWALPIIGALIAAGLGLRWLSMVKLHAE
jgi:hypothetical protein